MIKRVFYCDTCADERRWPYQIVRIQGTCIFCGISTMGSSTPACVLPSPPEIYGQLNFGLDVDKMRKDEFWPHKCSLMGCSYPELRPHHHHMHRGHLEVQICQCEHIDQPGTRPIR